MKEPRVDYEWPTWIKDWTIVNHSEDAHAGGQGSVVRVCRKGTGQIGALKRMHTEHLDSTERRYRMWQEVNVFQSMPPAVTSTTMRPTYLWSSACCSTCSPLLRHVLQDAYGRMPHEAGKDRFGAVLTDPRWPRLSRVFGIGFQPFDLASFQRTPG